MPAESTLPDLNPQNDRQMLVLLQMIRQIGHFGRLTMQLHRIVKCEGSCACACHQRTFMHTPSVLTKFFGSLFVGYAGLPIWSNGCDVSGCINQYKSTMQISYSFPSWFWHKALDITLAMTQMNEPCFAVKLRNRVPEYGENSIFQLARAGDTEGIKQLFLHKKASPNDLTISSGYSPIHVCIIRRNNPSFGLKSFSSRSNSAA